MYAQDNNSLPVWIISSQAHHHISINSQPFLVGIVSSTSVSSASRSSMSRSARVVAIAATVGNRPSVVGTVWTFVCPMSLLSTVVTDVVGFVTLLSALELLDEGVELCVGEGARRGLGVLQVAWWTASLVAKCLSILVFGKATDFSKGELTRDQVFVSFDLCHESPHL